MLCVGAKCAPLIVDAEDSSRMQLRSNATSHVRVTHACTDNDTWETTVAVVVLSSFPSMVRRILLSCAAHYYALCLQSPAAARHLLDAQTSCTAAFCCSATNSTTKKRSWCCCCYHWCHHHRGLRRHCRVADETVVCVYTHGSHQNGK